MTTSNTKIALLEQSMIQNQEDHKEIKVTLCKIDSKLDYVIENKADKDELNYWRNVLVSGILITIFVTIIINLLVN